MQTPTLLLIFIDFSPRPKTSTNKESESICVFRRYSDFETLRNYLVAKYSWVIVPVLPEKTVSHERIPIGLNRCYSILQISHTWSKSYQDRTSVEVVERRRVLLEVTILFEEDPNVSHLSVDVILLEISSSSLCSSDSLR